MSCVHVGKGVRWCSQVRISCFAVYGPVRASSPPGRLLARNHFHANCGIEVDLQKEVRDNLRELQEVLSNGRSRREDSLHPTFSPRAYTGLCGFRCARPAAASLQELMREMLVHLGEDPERDGLLHTPERMERSLLYLTKGYQENPEETLLDALFGVAYDEMVIVKDIEMFSLCEHHLLPFFGKVHVAYIPQGRVIGLSKVPRLVDVFARQLRVQKRLTTQIAEAIESAIKPQGVGVVVDKLAPVAACPSLAPDYPGCHRPPKSSTDQSSVGVELDGCDESNRARSHYFIGEKSVGRMYVESIFSTVLLASSDLSTS